MKCRFGSTKRPSCIVRETGASVRELYARRWGGGWLGPGVVGSAAVEDAVLYHRINDISIPLPFRLYST